MIKRNSLLAFFCVVIVFSITCPSIAYTSLPPDSIRVKWMEGKKYILHKVEPGETWQHLSRRYSCTVADLKITNEGVDQLKFGQIINIPASGGPATVAVADKNPGSPEQKPRVTTSAGGQKTPVLYKVKKGDTMYSISKKFNQEIHFIKSVNNLTSDVLSEGQQLTVTYTVSKSAALIPDDAIALQPQVTEQKQTTPQVKSAAGPSPDLRAETVVSPAAGLEKPTKSVSPLKKGNTGKTLMQVTETGVATWIRDGQVNPDKYYALHRSAPIGTIVKVTNRMNNQFVYVKVVGALPDTGDNENIVIKVSQAVSSKLNALDPLFQVEMNYGVMN